MSEQLRKLALAARENAEDSEQSHTRRNALMAAAAAAPSLGLIGQKPVLHDPTLDPSIRRMSSMKEISKAARPGDVIMTTKPHGSFWKSVIKPLSGSEFYHVQPVVGRSGGVGTTSSAGYFSGDDYKKDTLRQLQEQAPTIPAHMKEQGYKDVLLLRPKKKLTPQQIEAYVKENLARAKRPYNNLNAVGTWLHDTFVPKIPGLERSKNAPVCKGGVCSSAPAMAYNKAGLPIVKGKAARNAFPNDFLRSDALKPVGAFMSDEYKTSPAMRRAMPYLSRGALGAALAGGVYLGAQEPEAGALVPGAIAGSALGARLERALSGKKELAPGFLQGAFVRMFDGSSASRKKLLSRLAKGRIPGGVLGALGAYGGVKALSGALAKHRSAQLDSQPPQTDSSHIPE